MSNKSCPLGPLITIHDSSLSKVFMEKYFFHYFHFSWNKHFQYESALSWNNLLILFFVSAETVDNWSNFFPFQLKQFVTDHIFRFSWNKYFCISAGSQKYVSAETIFYSPYYFLFQLKQFIIGHTTFCFSWNNLLLAILLSVSAEKL